jgi:hypothetical protein
MVARPDVHPAWTTVGELRAFFEDDHVHMALLVVGGVLVGTVERGDLGASADDRAPALQLARLRGRTIEPGAALPGVQDTMRRTGRRRLAVTTTDATVVGLLCLKTSGDGFCSDADVSARRGVTASERPPL